MNSNFGFQRFNLFDYLVFLLARHFSLEMEQISPVAAARGSQKSTASGASAESSGSVTKRYATSTYPPRVPDACIIRLSQELMNLMVSSTAKKLNPRYLYFHITQMTSPPGIVSNLGPRYSLFVNYIPASVCIPQVRREPF